MATLSGTTIADTFDSLLHVEDNTAGLVASSTDSRVIQDGVGANSALALATDSVRITSTNKLYFNDNEGGEYIYGDTTDLRVYSGADILLMATGKVGIGIATPAQKLDIQDGDLLLSNSDSGSNHRTGFIQIDRATITAESNFGSTSSSGFTAGWKFATYNYTGSGFVTLTPFAIQANGSIGMGTTTPGSQLDIESRSTAGTGGGAGLRLGSNDGTVMVNTDRLGVIEFAGNENGASGDSATMTVGARIEAVADNTWSGTENGASLDFYTTDGDASQSQKMTILATGFVGIGEDAPDTLLHIKSATPWIDIEDSNASDERGKIGMNSDNMYLGASGPSGNTYIMGDFDVDADPQTGTIRTAWMSNGTVLIPHYGNGTASFASGTGLLATSSDERLKENVTTLSDGLSIVNQLNPVYFTWKEKDPSGEDNIMYAEDAPNGGKKLGFIAQQVGEVLPQFSPDWGKDDKQWRGIEDRAIIAALTKAIQELSAKVTALENA